MKAIAQRSAMADGSQTTELDPTAHSHSPCGLLTMKELQGRNNSDAC